MLLRAPLLFLLLVLGLCLSLPASAQTVRWEPNGGSLAVNRTSEIQLVFEGCEPEEEVRLPAVAGLQIDRSGSSENTSIINGRISKSVVLGFTLRPSSEGTLTLPSFAVKTDKGTLRVPATTFAVTQATAGAARVPLDQVSRARFEVPSEVWAGEVFPISYRLVTLRRYFSQFGSNLTWDSAPLIVEDWPKPTVGESLVNGERNLVFGLDSRAMAPNAGEITLTPGNQLVNLITGSSNMGFFASPNLEQFSIPTAPVTLRVKPLPPGAPATFQGAVGQFTLNSKLVPAQARVGEPITWTLSLAGTGNWPTLHSLPAREVSSDFRAVQAQPKRTLTDGQLFAGVLDEDVVLIPQQAGTYSFGPYTYTYFDPKRGTYATVTTEKHTLTILPAAPSTPTGGAGAGDFETRGSRPAPGLPAPVPGEALTTALGARAPLTPTTWLLLALLPGAGLLALAFALALRRALALDPEGPLRRARAAALTTLRTLATTTEPAARRRLLSQWQEAVARERAIPRLYPAAQAFAEDETWRRLWNEAEAYLFAADAALPGDWVARAEAALLARPAHSFTPKRLLQKGAWLPALLLVVGLLSPAPAARAEAGLAAYQRGDFLAAEAAWRTALEKDPLAAGLHLNLSLALAQQAQWPEATAHGTVAFIQAPAEAATQRNLRYLLTKPGLTPQVVPALLGDGPAAGLTRWTTPAGWQLATAGALGLVALGLALALVQRHGWRPRGLTAVRWVLVTGGLLALPFCLYSYFNYGLLREREAQLIWRETALYSVPTAADSEQQKSTVAAGTLAVREREFLSWSQVRFSDGQLGWVQSADLLPFWSARE